MTTSLFGARGRRWLAWSALCAVIAVAPAAEAQSPEAQKAEALFKEGRDAVEKGDHAAGCSKFRESLALLQRAGTLLNLAQCEEKLGQLVSALQHWREAIALLEPSDERIAAGKERMTSLEQRIPQLTVKLDPEAPPGSKISLDGKELSEAQLGTVIPLDAGDHVVVVTAPDRLEQRSKVRLTENERREVLLTPGPPKSATPPAGTTTAPPPPPPPPSGGARTAGFVVGGIGVVGLIGFGVTGALVAARDGDIQTACPEQRCSADGLSQIDGSKTLMIINAIALGVGVAGVGVGAVLILTSGSSDERPAVALGPRALPGGAGLFVSGALR